MLCSQEPFASTSERFGLGRDHEGVMVCNDAVLTRFHVAVNTVCSVETRSGPC